MIIFLSLLLYKYSFNNIYWQTLGKCYSHGKFSFSFPFNETNPNTESIISWNIIATKWVVLSNFKCSPQNPIWLFHELVKTHHSVCEVISRKNITSRHRPCVCLKTEHFYEHLGIFIRAWIQGWSRNGWKRVEVCRRWWGYCQCCGLACGKYTFALLYCMHFELFSLTLFLW